MRDLHIAGQARGDRTRQFPDDWQGAFIFACVINMNGLTTFNVGDDGAGFKGARRKGGDLLLRAFAQACGVSSGICQLVARGSRVRMSRR